MGALRRLVKLNERWSYQFNERVDRWTGRTSGMLEFDARLLPGLLRNGQRVLDVGGGKQPLIDVETKRRFGLHVTGLDLSADELAAAPAGAYDETVVGDVAMVKLEGPFDLLVSRTVLEHVSDTAVALQNLAAALAPGGIMAHFLPCGNAPFALLNRMLGPSLGSRLLWAVFPQSRRVAGFPAYYDGCHPTRFRRLCEAQGLEIVALNAYFYSDYGRFFLPLHLADTARQIVLMKAGAVDLAETFTIVARKPIGASRIAA